MAPSQSSSPGGDAHLTAAADHLAHADYLKTTGRADPITVGWAITALFYAALHAVRAYLKACKKIDVTSHDDFRQQVQQYTELRRTSVEYDLLKQESHAARYYCSQNFTWSDFEVLRKKADKVVNTWRDPTTRCIGGMTGKQATPKA